MGPVIETRRTFCRVCHAGPLDVDLIVDANRWGDLSVVDHCVREIGAPTDRLVSTSARDDPLTGMPVQKSIPGTVAQLTVTTDQGESWS